MARTIQMTIPLKGISKGQRKPSYETAGFTGESCRTATEAFEQALGSTVDEELKEEFYHSEEHREHTSEG